MQDIETIAPAGEIQGQQNQAAARIEAAKARVTQAFGRVEDALETFSLWALEKMTEPQTSAADLEEIENAKAARAQAEERLQRQAEAERERILLLEQRIGAQSSRLSLIGDELQGLRESNAELRALTEEMRASLEAQLEDPALVNRALEAELAALNANRAADLAEVTAAIAELKPFVEDRF